MLPIGGQGTPGKTDNGIDMQQASCLLAKSASILAVLAITA